MTDAAHSLISTTDELRTLVALVAAADEYAIDTEFHRERTYFPQLALIQIEVADSIHLVDPLAIDPAELRPAFESDALAILHAARQDLEVLEHAIGVAPRRVFDTQLAAGFLGYASPSLSSLLEGELGVRAPKADRLTDWLRRPLTGASAHLRPRTSRTSERCTPSRWRPSGRGRVGWVRGGDRRDGRRACGPRDPAGIGAGSRRCATSAAPISPSPRSWRPGEHQAQALDLTPRYVLADLALVGLAVARPTRLDDLKDIRGVDQRSLRNVADEMFAVIAGAATNKPRRDGGVTAVELPAAMRPAVPLVTAWVAQLSRELSIDPAIIATRADLEAFLRGDPDARLSRGWRYELVGVPLQRLVSGDVALAFDGDRGLVIEERSRRAAVEPGSS
ncbi:MAG: HRDC domain-containing protein [Acidimicrobiales bacterium]